MRATDNVSKYIDTSCAGGARAVVVFTAKRATNFKLMMFSGCKVWGPALRTVAAAPALYVQ